MTWSIHLKCDDCGKQDDSVYETTCPFAEEISGTIIDICICVDCYSERMLEI